MFTVRVSIYMQRKFLIPQGFIQGFIQDFLHANRAHVHVYFITHAVKYRITGNVCVAKFLSFKFLRDLIFV